VEDGKGVKADSRESKTLRREKGDPIR